MMRLYFRPTQVGLLMALAALATSNTARAELLIYDSFDYNVGQLASNDGGGGFDGEWQNSGSKTVEVAAGSKGYTDTRGNVLDTAGNHALLNDPDGRSGGKRAFDLFSIDQSLLNDNFNLGKDGTTLWMSFVMQSNNNIANTAGWAGITLNNRGGSQSGVIDLGHKQIPQIDGQAEANFGMGLGWGGTSPIPPQVQSDVPLTQQSLLVFRMDFLTYDAGTQTGADQIRMWVNPLLDATPSDAESLLLEFRWQDDSLEPSMEFNAFAFQQGPTAQQGQVFDEIRIGTAFADVTPFTASPGPLADFDADGDVDGADFLKWQRELGDAANLANWETEFGTTGALAAIAAVPEPASVFLLGMAFLSICATRKCLRCP